MRLLGFRGAGAILAVLCLALAVILYRKSAECESLSSRNDTLYRQAKALEALVDRGRRQTDSLSTQLRGLSRRLEGLAPSPIHGLYIDRLRERGLQNPVEDLITDLGRHPELIPYPGVLGGRMSFYGNIDRIRVLSDSWVYAPFEDGHVTGEAIFGYRIVPDGTISWRVVVSRMR